MGTLYVVSTPIGNLEDITIRAIKTLFTADVIACEDSRHTGLLLQELKKRHPQLTAEGRKSQLIPYHEHNEMQQTSRLVELLEQDNSIALVSDAGTPLISDPGFLLIRECHKRNIPVVPIPGPSSVITALSISGLPTDNFWFVGYLPKKQGRRTTFLKSMLSCFKTIEHQPMIVFFEAPHRLHESLVDFKAVFGDIEIVVCKELTKMHEEVFQGTVAEILSHFPTPQGEYVILFHL